MIALLRELNDLSPFVWEISTDGVHFTVWCEQLEVVDTMTGECLTDLSETDCTTWLGKLIKRAKGDA